MTIGPDAAPSLGGIAVNEETLEWREHLIRITQQPIAIAIGQIHRHHHPVKGGGTVAFSGGQIKRLQHLEQVQQSATQPPLRGGIVGTR